MRLREERKRLGFNQEQFAALTNVATRQSQSNYEKSLRSPDAEYLAAIATAGADVAYIITGRGRVDQKLDRRCKLPARLRAWRRALGLTKEQFAGRAGISQATLIGCEVGQRKPGADDLAAIARTGVNMTWLLTGEGETRPAPPPAPWTLPSVPARPALAGLALVSERTPAAPIVESERVARLEASIARITGLIAALGLSQRR